MSNYKICAYVDETYVEKDFRFINEAIGYGEQLAEGPYDHIFLLVRRESGFYQVTMSF